MKKGIILFISLCLIFTLAACKQPTAPNITASHTISSNSNNSEAAISQEETIDPYPLNDISDALFAASSDKKIFNGNSITFSIPVDWEGKERSMEDSSIYYFRHPELKEKCELRYDSTFAELLGSKRTEQEYLEYLSYNNFKDIIINSFTTEKIGGYDSTKVISSYSLENTEFIRIDYDYIIVGARLYHFTITYPASDSDIFEPIFNSIISSIEFKVS